MTFITQLNELVLIFAGSLFMFLFIGIRLGYVRGGWNVHMSYIWTLIIYSVYIFITPLFYYFTDQTVIIGTDVSRYFGAGFLFNNLAVVTFIIGYWINADQAEVIKPTPHVDAKKVQFYISILFYSFYAIVLANLAAGGANITGLFTGNEVLGLGASGASYFLQNFTDSLVCLIVLAYLFKMPLRLLLIWIIAAFFLFSLLGFRYRIILSLFGILFVYLYRNKIDVKRIIAGGIMALVFFYGIMFSTENRRALIFRDYSDLTFNPLEFEYKNFFYQTRGSLADMAIFKLYDNPNKIAEHDYGITMFGYVFIRMIPRAIYPDKDKFYPPPQLATTLQAYDAWWAKQAGEATLSVGAFYIALGWLGVIFGHFFWGLLLRKFTKRINLQDELQVAMHIIVALVSFQWATRGYFPQAIDHFVYMMIPIWILRYLYKKSDRLANN